MGTDIATVLEGEIVREEEMTAQDEGTVLEEDMTVRGEAVQEEDEVQDDTVDLDHNYFIYLLNCSLADLLSKDLKVFCAWNSIALNQLLNYF